MLADQQESALFISIRERYEELPPIIQRAVLWSGGGIVMLMLLWWPMSNLMESSDVSTRFEEKRGALKELFKLSRDIQSAPDVPIAPRPMSIKAQFDQEVANAGVKPDQVKEAVEIPTSSLGSVEKVGILYRIGRITIKQAVDLGYNLQKLASGLHLAAFNLTADKADPHFYEVVFKIISYTPKMAEVVAPEPLKGGLPRGTAPKIPGAKGNDN